MKSICIKTNNTESINYLLEELNNMSLNGLHFSCKKFKNYNNIIIHFFGNNHEIFLQKISELLSALIFDIYTEGIIDNLLLNDYFYFDSIERKNIANLTINDLFDDEAVYNPDDTSELIYNSFHNYLSYNKSIVLQGFITFRLKKFFKILTEQIDKSVNKFVIQQEYSEFITLLKTYINTENSLIDIVHLFYYDSKPILLNSNKEKIEIETNIFNAKYFSDISFSSCDYTLNTLLSLVPQKIYIHLNNTNIDEFIKTIKLIFENRVICCIDA